MIKLLKYDWKRSNDGILSTLAILIILEAALSITGFIRDWEDAIVLSFSIFGYVLALILLFIHCCRTYDGNIKSFSRRLIPLHPIHGIGAIIILSWIILLLVTIIALIHITIYLNFSDASWSEWHKIVEFKHGGLFGIVVAGLWTYTSIIIAILASITVARSFRMKRSAWIGIVFFFAVQSLIAWFNSLLFDSNQAPLGIISMETSSVDPGAVSFASSLNTDYLFGPSLLELAVNAGFLLLTIYLLNKKVEV